MAADSKEPDQLDGNLLLRNIIAPLLPENDPPSTRFTVEPRFEKSKPLTERLTGVFDVGRLNIEVGVVPPDIMLPPCIDTILEGLIREAVFPNW
ncbi:hypothetical protein EBAPG3_010450 [Nitrosospira lacus]|uniref:Uncharacterized protein n=1 Tax=Nitrosospira lacus TaxID=1288494 RepID=A0A1W6SQX0_9PROT|nr:hypothetical protein [Nitrosospira lacus]ARO88162.1 hypothetical protein EBAPG3_010450 [Nitrosospira lacus]